LQGQNGVRVVDARIDEREQFAGAKRLGASGDQDKVAVQVLRRTAARQHGHGVGIDEGSSAAKLTDTMPLQIVPDALALAVLDKALAGEEVLQTHLLLEADIKAEDLPLTEAGQEEGGFAQGLGG